jgi:hypothetical protein
MAFDFKTHGQQKKRTLTAFKKKKKKDSNGHLKDMDGISKKKVKKIKKKSDDNCFKNAQCAFFGHFQKF